jgi:hypothetical protein
VTSAQQQFGLRLRRERESRGVSLDAIAASTKIGKALFVGLERGDLSRWPSGVYCRAHVCGYAAAIGLSPADVLAEFNDVYPDRCGHEGGSTPHAPVAECSDSLRLTFARSAAPTAQALTRRACVAAAEALVLAGASAALSSVAGLDVWRIASVAAFLYYPLAIASLGETAGFRLLTIATAAMRSPKMPRHAEDLQLAAFVDEPVTALPQSGGMRLHAANPVPSPMILDRENASEAGTPHEYMLH